MINRKLTSRNKYGSVVKWLLHTRVGSCIGFHLGISGYNHVSAVIKPVRGKMRRVRRSYNARVNVGAALTAYLMSGSNLGSLTSPAVPKYIALSTNVLSIGSGDTTLSGETAGTGLARAAGTIGGYVAPSTLDGSASYTITKTFTNNSGGPVTIQSAGLFDAASTGNLFVEANLFSSASLPNPGDQVVISWVVNV